MPGLQQLPLCRGWKGQGATATNPGHRNRAGVEGAQLLPPARIPAGNATNASLIYFSRQLRGSDTSRYLAFLGHVRISGQMRRRRWPGAREAGSAPRRRSRAFGRSSAWISRTPRLPGSWGGGGLLSPQHPKPKLRNPRGAAGP